MASFNFRNVFNERTLRRHTYFLTFLSAFFGSIWVAIMIWSSNLTLQSHVFVLTNLHGVLSLFIMFLFRGNMSKEEKVLSLLLVVGLICIVFDPFSYRWDMLVPGKHHKKAITVDFILILSNIPAALFFSFNKMLMTNRIVKHILIVNLMMMLIFMVMAVLYDDA